MQIRSQSRLNTGDEYDIVDTDHTDGVRREILFIAPIDIQPGDKVEIDMSQLIYSGYRVLKVIRGRRIRYKRPPVNIARVRQPEFRAEYGDSPLRHAVNINFT